MHAKFRAHTNIALIKYWGKRNDNLILPVTDSLSLTLDAFYTDTLVMRDTEIHQDFLFINDQLQGQQATQKVSRFVDLFRSISGSQDRVYIQSHNHVPTAAGLASSASGFAALACALNAAFELNLDLKTLSTLARQGSGSACRSLYGGFVQWHKGKGDDTLSSYAAPFDSANWGVAMLVLIVNDQEKTVSSRIGMKRTIGTSPFYALWPQEVASDIKKIKQAIRRQDFTTMGEIAEHNAMKMHATTLAANPSFTYWSPKSLETIQFIQFLREELGFSAYITMDAGPNIKVLCPPHQLDALYGQLRSLFDDHQIIKAYPGPGPYALPID